MNVTHLVFPGVLILLSSLSLLHCRVTPDRASIDRASGRTDRASTNRASTELASTNRASTKRASTKRASNHAPIAETKMTYLIRGVGLEIERQPDGDKYPLYLKEHYQLDSQGLLHYHAYFGGMPLHMNHTDSTTWQTGEHGKQVLLVLSGIFHEATLLAELALLPDDAPQPAPGKNAYTIAVTRDQADSTFVIKNQTGQALQQLEVAFTAMVGAFERSTGRPLKATDLPQSAQ